MVRLCSPVPATTLAMVLRDIPLREVLHFLGWRGTPLDDALVAEIRALIGTVVRDVQPRVVHKRFQIVENNLLAGTSFAPAGSDMAKMLAPCSEAVLLCGTLGAQSERLLLRTQAQDAAKAVLLDAVLSAGIEAVMDEQERILRTELAREGLYLTDRFSPGYGDMPLAQSREICEVLGAQRMIGLTVSASSILIPRKSVTAVMGISESPVERRSSGCEVCQARDTCALRRRA